MSYHAGTDQNVSILTDALRTYSTISNGMATEVLAASGAGAMTSTAELAGALGPIGKGFLAAFHQAESAHLDSARKVSVAHAAMAQQSSGAAAAYDGADEDSAALTESLRRSS